MATSRSDGLGEAGLHSVSAEPQLSRTTAGVAAAGAASPPDLQTFADFHARELKTCASIIRGWTELLSRDMLAGDELQSACERIQQACARIVLVASQIEVIGGLAEPSARLPGDGSDVSADGAREPR